MNQILQSATMIVAMCFILGCQSNPKLTDVSGKEPATGPKLTRPVIKKVWVPETIEDDGRVLIEGHYKWLLEKDSTWSR